MRHWRGIAGIGLATSLWLGNPVAARDVDPPAAPVPCRTAAAAIDHDFPTGAFAGCAAEGASRFRLTIAPETPGRINCSPWYAFRITPARRGRVVVDLDYRGCGHRYRPRVSDDGVVWTALPPSAVTVSGTGADRRARLTVRVGARPMFVAAQEIIAPATYAAWAERAARAPGVERALLGTSLEGRPIERLTVGDPASAPVDAAGAGGREVVVLLGRQHPPEISGALGMFAFADTVMGDSAIARAYRARFDTIIVPMLNPDGVVRGHWRHNMGGVDLNRDWGRFTQPETRLMQALLEGIAANPARRLRALIDFHSTDRDVFYTIPDQLPTDPPLFTKNWLDRLQQRMPDYAVASDANHRAGAGNSKAWVFERFGVPGVTFEFGDQTDRALIARLGRESALAMMETLLAVPPPQPGAAVGVAGTGP